MQPALPSATSKVKIASPLEAHTGKRRVQGREASLVAEFLFRSHASLACSRSSQPPCPALCSASMRALRAEQRRNNDNVWLTALCIVLLTRDGMNADARVVDVRRGVVVVVLNGEAPCCWR